MLVQATLSLLTNLFIFIKEPREHQAIYCLLQGRFCQAAEPLHPPSYSWEMQEMASELARHTCSQMATLPARHPHWWPLGSDPPSGSTEARTGRGRGTGCAGHLSPMTRSPRGQPSGGWEAEPRPVPTACPQRAWEEAGQQVVGQLEPGSAPTCFC